MNKYTRIAIIEIDYHPEVLRNTLIILNELPIFCEVFTSETLWKQVALDNNKFNKITVHLIDKKKHTEEFFRNNINFINNCDFVFFNTLASKFKFFTKFKFSSPVILRVHNANTYLNQTKSISPKISLFYLWKDASYIFMDAILKFELYYRKKFVNEKVDYFCFPSKQVSEYVKKQKLLPENKILEDIPFVFSKTKFNESLPKSPIVIAIIGLIDKRKRNYAEVYHAIKQTIPNSQEPVELRLLGKPMGWYGKFIIRKFKRLENDKFKLTYYESFIKQSNFEKQIKTTHFLIIPAYKQTRFKLFKELYGYTKISGNVNDIITFGKPAIIPSFYPLPETLDSLAIRYDNKHDLKDALQNWIIYQPYLKFKFEKIFNEYSLKKAANRIETSLIKI